jgi:hypothetical protein
MSADRIHALIISSGIDVVNNNYEALTQNHKIDANESILKLSYIHKSITSNALEFIRLALALK